MRKFKDLVGEVFEHEGTRWRITKAGSPGGFTWRIAYWFEPAEWEEDSQA